MLRRGNPSDTYGQGPASPPQPADPYAPTTVRVIEARQPDARRCITMEPVDFNDAQTIGDHIKQQTPVIVNLRSTLPDLSQRLIDFCSGVAYGIEATIRRVARQVLLLTPKDVVVSEDERKRLAREGLYDL